MKHEENGGGRVSAPDRSKEVDGALQRENNPPGRLEREDIVILVLSVVLVIATLWLATEVL